jgi:hypothetical protein
MGSGADASGETDSGTGYGGTWWSDHRPQAAVIAIGVLFLAIVWSGLLFYIQERDRAAFAQAENDVASWAATLGEQIERSILKDAA